MNASYWAEQSTRLYKASDEWKTEDPKDRYANAKNTAATYARMAAAKLRDVSQALAEEERAVAAEKPEA
jgi:hypothetical protein